MCEFMRQCAADLKARWAPKRRKPKRPTQHANGQDTLRDGAMAAADPELRVKSSGPARPGPITFELEPGVVIDFGVAEEGT